ncbi:MAG: CoA-binding protein [Hyphomicrobiaceae bacterium]
MNHDRYADSYITDILASVGSIAMVGASANTNRPSYFALKYLLGKGYAVHPVNPGLAGKELLGRQVYGDLSEIPAPVDMVDIFRGAEAAGQITQNAIELKDKLGIKVIWMQLTVRNDEAASAAESAGMRVVMNRCPKIEYGRLSGEIGWVGVYNGVITSARPRLSPHSGQSLLLSPRS